MPDSSSDKQTGVIPSSVTFGYQHGVLWGHGVIVTIKRMPTGYEVVELEPVDVMNLVGWVLDPRGCY